MHKYLIGVDEAGRGPLAGPVAVGVALVREDFDWNELPGVTDSKQLSEGKREELFVLAKALKKAGKLDFAVSMTSAAVIDRIGIVPAVNVAMKRALNRLSRNVSINVNINTNIPAESLVLLDGGLKAPAEYLKQETIIKGDAKEPVIGLASIMAKVTRDRYMTRISVCKGSPYTDYDFHIHKGYGTKTHRSAIATHGLSPEHRATFCQNLLVL